LKIDTYFWNSYSKRLVEWWSNDSRISHPEILVQGITYIATRCWTPFFLQWNQMIGSEGIRSLSESLPTLFSQISADKQVKKYFPMKGSNWTCLYLFGTTFSGHPTRTTLGNTLRSLCYHHYFASDIQTKFIVASGDDVCVWTTKVDVERYVKKMLDKTARNIKEAEIGIGQCIKEYKIGEWWDMDFCSKQCSMHFGEWGIYRDARKIWREKMFYVGGLQIFHQKPELHLVAMMQSAEAELNCPLAKNFYLERIERLASRRKISEDRKKEIESVVRFNRNQLNDLYDVYRIDSRKYKWEEAKMSKEIDPTMSVGFILASGWSITSMLLYGNGSEVVPIS